MAVYDNKNSDEAGKNKPQKLTARKSATQSAALSSPPPSAPQDEESSWFHYFIQHYRDKGETATNARKNRLHEAVAGHEAVDILQVMKEKWTDVMQKYADIFIELQGDAASRQHPAFGIFEVLLHDMKAAHLKWRSQVRLGKLTVAALSREANIALAHFEREFSQLGVSSQPSYSAEGDHNRPHAVQDSSDPYDALTVDQAVLRWREENKPGKEGEANASQTMPNMVPRELGRGFRELSVVQKALFGVRLGLGVADLKPHPGFSLKQPDVAEPLGGESLDKFGMSLTDEFISKIYQLGNFFASSVVPSDASLSHSDQGSSSWFGVAASPIPDTGTRFTLVPSEQQDESAAQEKQVLDNHVADNPRVKLSGTLLVNQHESTKETINDYAYSLPADEFIGLLRKVHGTELKNNPEVYLPLLPSEDNSTELVAVIHSLPLKSFLQLPYDLYSAAHYIQYPVEYPASFSAELIEIIDRYRMSVDLINDKAGNSTTGIDELDAWLKNSKFVETLLKSSRVETKRRDAYQWIDKNKIAATSIPSKITLQAISDGISREQWFNKIHGQEYDTSHKEMAKILTSKGVTLDTQKKFNDFKNGLGRFIPINDMLHLSEEEVAKNLASQHVDISMEDIGFAIKVIKSGTEGATLPPDVSANSILLREINLYTQATEFQKSSSQKAFDNYLLAATEKYTDPDKAMDDITRQRIDKSGISLTHQKYTRPTEDTPVRLVLEHGSWMDNKNLLVMVYNSIFGDLDSIETTLSGLVSGSWRTEHAAKLGFLAKIIDPLAHYTSIIKEAFLNGTKTLTPQEITILTADINEEAFEFESFSLYADKEINEVMQRGKTRQGLQAAGVVKEQIQLGIAPESIYENSGNISADKILISLLNGEPVEHTTIIAKSKTGDVVIPDIILLPISQTNSVIFSLKTAEIVMITATTHLKFHDHSMTDQLPHDVYEFLISHMDPQQLQDATIKNSNSMEQILKDYEDLVKGSRMNYGLKESLWHQYATRVNFIKHGLQESYKDHKDYDKYKNIISVMTNSPEDFKNALLLYANLHPDEGKEIVVKTGARKMRNQPLIDTVSENLFGNMLSGFHTFDLRVQNQAELSQEQWRETGWFLLSLALGAATGLTMGVVGATLQFGPKFVWALQTLASAGVSGAEELLKANAETNEEKRKAAFAGIKYEVIFSLLADVGMDKLLIPVVKKIVKNLRNGINPLVLKPIFEGFAAVKGKNLREFSQHFDQSSSINKIELLTEKIMETDEVFSQLQTIPADKIRQKVKDIITRNPHRLEEGGFVNAYCDVLEKLKPLTNQGIAKRFTAMDTYTKIAYLKDYSVNSASGKELAIEFGPQGASLVNKLVDDRLSLTSLGRSKSAFNWQTENIHKGTLDVELKIESRRLRNIKGTLALMAQENSSSRSKKIINIPSTITSIQHWIQTSVGGSESINLSPDLIENMINRYSNIDLTQVNNLNKLYRDIYHPETPTLNRYMGDNLFLSNRAGMEGYSQWLRSVDTTRSDFPELNLNAMTMFQLFPDANGIMARLTYGIILLKRGYHFKPVDIPDYHPDNLIIPFDQYSNAPANIDYRKGQKIADDNDSTVYYHNENNFFAKDYKINHDPDVFLKAEQNVELLNRYYYPGFAKIYRYYENGLQKITVTFSKATGQSFDNIVKKYVASAKIEALFNELAESDIDTIVKNSVEAMKEMNIFHPEITMFNANFNRNQKRILITNFDSAEVNSPGMPIPQFKLDIMADKFRELFNEAKEQAAILRNRQLGDKQKQNSLRVAFSEIKTNYEYSKTKDHEYNAEEFSRGVTYFKSDTDKAIAQVKTLLPENYLDVDDITLINRYNEIITGTTSHGTVSHYHRGILFEIINRRKDMFVRIQTIKTALLASGSRKNIIRKNANYVLDLDQESLLASLDMHYTNGVCLPMSYIGIVALANDIEKPWAKNYSNILKSNSPRKGARVNGKLEQGKAYMEDHLKIYNQKIDAAFQNDLGELNLPEIIDKLEQCKKSSYFLLQTKSHSMTVAVKINKDNKKHFYFIDPSVSMAEYTKSKDMLAAMESTIGKSKIENDLGKVKPQFRLIEITDTKGLGDTQIIDTNNPKLYFMDLANGDYLQHTSLVSLMDLSTPSLVSQLDPKFVQAETELIKAIRDDKFLQALMEKPLEKCREATQKTLEIARNINLPSEIIQLLSWNKQLKGATNHYALQFEVNGKKYVLDTTLTQNTYLQSKILNNEIIGSGQEVFDQKVYIGPANAWFKLMKEAEEAALLKVQISKNGRLLKNIVYAIGTPSDVPGLTLNQPNWFKRKMSREMLYNNALLNVRANVQVAVDKKLLTRLAEKKISDNDFFFDLDQGEINFLGMRNKQALSKDFGLNNVVPFKPRNVDDLKILLDRFENINEAAFAKMSANAKGYALSTLYADVKTNLITQINGKYKYGIDTRVNLAKLLAEIEMVKRRFMYKEYNYADPFAKSGEMSMAEAPLLHSF
ncbi:hypothetical protein SPM24T3_08994 [Serratia sp. M24T3]|nr:hypothetical protein SPM24T3_08994 [Serratia sp. M24T3]